MGTQRAAAAPEAAEGGGARNEEKKCAKRERELRRTQSEILISLHHFLISKKEALKQ